MVKKGGGRGFRGKGQSKPRKDRNGVVELTK
jgi:hypothetical protein